MKIMVIFTGGTISMERINNSAVISSSFIDILNTINSSLQDIEIKHIELFMKPSPHISIEDMKTLGDLINKFALDDDIKGIVVTHGTDTLEETAYFLDLYTNTSKPVVITGSMRNISELSYDGPSNLANAILVANSKYSLNRGVLVVLNGEINSAREVTITHTMALDTFKSLEYGPLGVIDSDDVYYYRDIHFKRRNITPKCILSNVEIIKCYADANSNLINYLVENNTKGIILEGLGRENVPIKMIEGIKNALNKNIPIVLTSRCMKGRVLDSYGYEGGGNHLKKLGVIFGDNLNSQKARIKLILAISQGYNFQEIKNIFEKK